jgi:hypothetical protein
MPFFVHHPTRARTIHHIHPVSRQATFKGDMTLEDDSEDDYTMQVQSVLIHL